MPGDISKHTKYIVNLLQLIYTYISTLYVIGNMRIMQNLLAEYLWLERIIADEKLHVKLFKEMYANYRIIY